MDTVYISAGDPTLTTLTRDKRKDGPKGDTLTVTLVLTGMSGYLADKRAELTNKADTLLSAFMSAFQHTGCSKAELRLVANMPPATFYRSLNSLVNLGLLVNDGTDKRPHYRGGSTVAVVDLT